MAEQTPIYKYLWGTVGVFALLAGLYGWNISDQFFPEPPQPTPMTSEDRQLDDQRHQELLDEIAREKGVRPVVLIPLFNAAGLEVPESNFEAAIRDAIARIEARAAEAVPDFDDDEAVEEAIRFSRERLAQLDTEGATAHLEAAIADLQAERERERLAEARLHLELAEIERDSFAWQDAAFHFEQAGTLNPADTWAWFEGGDIHRLMCDLPSALAAYEQGQGVAEDVGNERDLSVSHNRIGDVEFARGNTEAALAAYQASLAIREKLAA